MNQTRYITIFCTVTLCLLLSVFIIGCGNKELPQTSAKIAPKLRSTPMVKTRDQSAPKNIIKENELASPTSQTSASVLKKKNTLLNHGADFTRDARKLLTIASCDDGFTPKGKDKKIITAHCKKMKRLINIYRKRYVEKARPWFKKNHPENLPQQVIYPFGGGDLLSALTTYSNADLITTMSLEHAGDIRGISTIHGEKLEKDLELLRQTIKGLLTQDDSKSTNMMMMQTTEIPGQLAFFITALSVYHYQLIKLRYFKIQDDGRLHYFSDSEIKSLEKNKAKKLSGGWVHPKNSKAFSNSELIFKDPKSGQIITHRHIAANLGDKKLSANQALLAYLNNHKTLVAMTKAAAYLLWRPDFSTIRNFLLKKMSYMVSDSTGIPPRFSKKNGFVIETYGRYQKCFFKRRFDKLIDAEMIDLWKKSKKLPFRYGYPDRDGRWHLMITKQAS